MIYSALKKTATQKEIKQAFFKLSKEYHPDSNAADNTLHDKFVKINEAFSILSKQSTRTTYDQALYSPPRTTYQPYPYPRRYSPHASPFDWSNMNFGGNQQTKRTQQTNRSTSNESDWGTPHFDRTFFEMLRRKMESDRRQKEEQRRAYYQSGFTYPPPYVDTYFAPASIILFVIVFGVLLHALQWRIMRYSDPAYGNDPRNRHYHAYREWQRLSALKDAHSMPLRDSSSHRSSDDHGKPVV